MREAGGVGRLVRGDELPAGLVATGGDVPWLNARVRPAAGFAKSGRCSMTSSGGWTSSMHELEQREAAYRRIREVVRLLAPDGRPVPEFLLHIDDDDAWRRCSDEPFPEKDGESWQSRTLLPRWDTGMADEQPWTQVPLA